MLFLSNYRKNILKEYTDIDYNFNKYFKRHRKKQLCFLNIESCYIYYLLYNIELIFLHLCTFKTPTFKYANYL